MDPNAQQKEINVIHEIMHNKQQDYLLQFFKSSQFLKLNEKGETEIFH